MKLKIVIAGLSVFILLIIIASSCIAFKYVYFEQGMVLLPGIDVDKSLDIAELKLRLGGFDSILGLWALRDQIITPPEAERINSLYLKYIGTIDNEFGVWHLAWAVSNFYRLGNDDVKEKLKSSYEDAIKRPGTLKQFGKIADEHINGKKIYMGFIHDLGKSFAHSHLIVPGNKEFLQSFDDFVRKSKNNKKLTKEIVKWKEEKKIEN
jgi:hypothetical protein